MSDVTQILRLIESGELQTKSRPFSEVLQLFGGTLRLRSVGELFHDHFVDCNCLSVSPQLLKSSRRAFQSLDIRRLTVGVNHRHTD